MVDNNLYRMPYKVYEQIANLELIRPIDHVVLLDGLLVQQPANIPPHSTAIMQGMAVLETASPPGWHVQCQQPVDLRDGPNGDSAPEPDLAVVFGAIRRYEKHHPTASETGLVFEVAPRSESFREIQLWLTRYAFANIPIACVLNLPESTLEVYSNPSGPLPDAAYRTVTILQADQAFACEIGNATTGPAALAPIPVSAFFT